MARSEHFSFGLTFLLGKEELVRCINGGGKIAYCRKGTEKRILFFWSNLFFWERKG